MNAWDGEDVYGVFNCIPTAELERLEIAFDAPSNERSRIPTAFARVSEIGRASCRERVL